MPTKNPIIQAMVSVETKEILKEIAKKEKRSISNLAGYIIDKYIEEYKTGQKEESVKIVAERIPNKERKKL